MKIAVIRLNRRGILGRQVTSPKTWHRVFGPSALLINISEICPSRSKAEGGGRRVRRTTKMGESKTVHSALVTYTSVISLLTLCPPFVILLWYTMVHADGSVLQTFEYLKQHGLQGLKDILPAPSPIAWKLIACFGAFEAILQLALPGKRVEGPISPNGNIPVYKANGLQAYAVTLVTYLSLWWFGIFNPAIVYDHLGEIYSALVMGSLVFCLFLYLKGHVAPSSSDSGSSGNFIIDFYWGMELYPRIGKHFDIKVFTNCRFGMMSWAVLAVTYCIKQYEMNGQVSDSMLVNTVLMLVYITKFFWWEAGYWCTMDIAHDRAGFYICWGCLVWVPSIYTSPGMYLVNHPVSLGTQLAVFILMSGLLCIYINYDCDRQRQEFRRTNGKCLIWGKAPSKYEMNGQVSDSMLVNTVLMLVYITKFFWWEAGYWCTMDIAHDRGSWILYLLGMLGMGSINLYFPWDIVASYRTEKGETKTSLLLTSGWWGVSRHFHYVPEILAAFFWTVPALFNHFLPYFYVLFLTILLFDRAKRDDDRCASKYGKYWKMYCNKVPYRVIPGIY
ncbi:hypothetical protein C4D60_Mb06t31650 [Musa balbisiana]|uniref:7-dehydrocholesterol reductase n=1 Tax=Musa balbisiana TaxID=52838 RepID=A0A4V6T456_MUSBA|nr:hypothetical protein C4D60_Mb06t31650 [Musa balbisiana]